MMDVFIEKENKTVKEDNQGMAKDVLKRLGVNPETVLIVRDGQLITQEDSIEGCEKLELLSVISGG